MTPRTHWILIKESEENIGQHTASKTTSKKTAGKGNGSGTAAGKQKAGGGAANGVGFSGMQGMLNRDRWAHIDN